MPTSNKQRKPRSPVKLKPITDERKLVSRKEAARILGFHPDSLKKLEDHHGGPLKVIRLTGPTGNVFYRLDQIYALTA